MQSYYVLAFSASKARSIFAFFYILHMVIWLFKPFTIFATFSCLEMKYEGMKLTCYFHNLPKEMFLCGFVSYEDVKVIKCWLWHYIKVCIGKKIAQSFPLVYFMDSNNNFATG